MATIALTIPDAALPRVVDALCARGHYAPEEGAKGAFAKRVLADWLKDEVRRYELEQARLAALANVSSPTAVDIT